MNRILLLPFLALSATTAPMSASAAIPAAPIAVLPTGITTTHQPRIEWRGQPSEAYQVLVTAEPATASTHIWDSGIVVSPDSYTTAVATLPANKSLYTYVRTRATGIWSEWSTRTAPFRVHPLPQPDGVLVTYDLDYTRKLERAAAFEHAHLASVLQGLVNRDQPRLFINFVKSGHLPAGVDGYWLDRLRQPEGWLKNKTLEPVNDIAQLVERFRPFIKGAVVWDPEVDATSNVASTIAGADNLIPIRYDPAPGSLYTRLISGAPQLPVVVNLVGKFTGTGIIPGTGRPSTGSKKCDAYLWAVDKYLATGRSDPYFMGYYLDAYWTRFPSGHEQLHTLTNHDYFVSMKGFFWDLSPWADEKPVDDPDQPLGTDLATLKEIYSTAAQRLGPAGFIHTGGFTPWLYKYTDYKGAGGKHDGVPTEWETSRILSSYNSYIDADAPGLSAMANASLYTHMPQPGPYTQPLPPLPEELRRAGLLTQSGEVTTATYILHYVGDYDSAAWVTAMMPRLWDAPERGTVPMAWAVNPNLRDRAPMFFDYAYQTRTANDVFIAGDSGAGYINPTQLFPPRQPSGLPSGVQRWQQHCARYYQDFGLTFTGFVINGSAGRVTTDTERLYEPFSSDGIIIQESVQHAGVHLENDMPVFLHNSDLSGKVADDVARINNYVKPAQTSFLMFRSILRPVKYYADLNRELQASRPDVNFVFCSPRQFSYLARKHMGGKNDRRITFLYNTSQATSPASTAEIAIRNDGWDTWQPGPFKLPVRVGDETTATAAFPAQVTLPRAVPPGDAVVLSP